MDRIAGHEKGGIKNEGKYAEVIENKCRKKAVFSPVQKSLKNQLVIVFLRVC